MPTTRRPAPYQPHWLVGLAVIEQAEQGVPTARADALAGLLGLSLKDLAGVLQIAERTLHRFRQEGRLDRFASERLLLLENVAAHGLAVFDGNAEALAHWLRYPLRELNGHPPLALLGTISGFGLVDDVLTRIEHGVYA